MIDDLTRSGRPLVYKEKHQLKLIGFYCQTQPFESCGKWSLRLAELHIKNHSEIIDFKVSKSTIHRILKNHNLKPHRSKYFLHISDPDFFYKMNHLIELYLNPPKHLICFDESPGIQVLQRLVPDLQTENMKIKLEEFEYIRHGTIDLFTCLDVNSGKVFSECKAMHNTENLVDFLESHILSIPINDKIDYIMDNLNTHCNYKVCILVAKYSYIKCPHESELDSMKKRRKWLSQPDKRIVFHYTPFHGSWLNMVEIWFGIIGQKCLKESFSSPDDMFEGINSFVNIWNSLMAHPFEWTYTGVQLPKRVIKRFTQTLLSPKFKDIELRILTKQLTLINNMYNDNYNDIQEELWINLIEVFSKTINIIKNIINKEKGQTRERNAKLALKQLVLSFNLKNIAC